MKYRGQEQSAVIEACVRHNVEAVSRKEVAVGTGGEYAEDCITAGGANAEEDGPDGEGRKQKGEGPLQMSNNKSLKG